MNWKMHKAWDLAMPLTGWTFIEGNENFLNKKNAVLKLWHYRGIHPGPYPPMYPGLPPMERERLGLSGPPHPGMDPNEQMVSKKLFSLPSTTPFAIITYLLHCKPITSCFGFTSTILLFLTSFPHHHHHYDNLFHFHLSLFLLFLLLFD